MKRFLSMLIALCMVISMLPVAAFAAGELVLDQTFYATIEEDTKDTYTFSPNTKGTLTITVGDGSTNWSSDVMYFGENFSLVTVGSASGSEAATYSVELDPDETGTYRIRFWETDGGALQATPVLAVWEPEGGQTGVVVEGDVLSGYVMTDGVAAEELTPMAGTDVALAGGYYPEAVQFQFTPAADGILTVHIIDCSTPWWFSGENLTSNKTGTGERAMTFEVRAGTTYTFDAGGYEVDTEGFTTACTLSYEVLFYEAELEAVKEKYVFSETVITAAGDYDVAMEENTESTIVTFTPDATGVYAITVENGTIADLKNNATLVDMFLNNEYVTALEWTCQEIAGIETDTILDENNQPIEITRETEGQSLYIGLKTEGTATISIEKIGEYNPEEAELQTYTNKASLSKFAIPEGYVVGGYIDVAEEHTAVLGEDGYYHLDSVNGDILLVDMDYMTVLTDALTDGRGVMYVTLTDEEGNITEKWDVGEACRAYERVTDDNKYYPLTEDLMFFYDEYAASNGVYSYIGIDAEAPSAWMFACLTMYDPTSGTIDVASYGEGAWTAALTGTVTFTSEVPFVLLDSSNNLIAEAVNTATVDVTAGDSYYFIDISGVNFQVSYEYAEGAEGGEDDEDEVPTSGSFLVEGYFYCTWTAPADGEVVFTVDPAVELSVWKGSSEIATTANGTVTLDVAKGESFDFVDMYDGVDSTVTWEYTPSGDEELPSDALNVGVGENIYWTAPATGTVAITVDPAASQIMVYGPSSWYTPELEITSGSGTLNVTKDAEYTFFGMPDNSSAAAVSIVYTSVEGGDEGGDEPAYNYTDLILGNNSVEGADAHWIYTASTVGTLTLDVGNAIMGPVAVSYTVNDGDAVAVENGTSVEIALSIGDVVKVDAIGTGYCTVGAAWGAQAVDYVDLVIGNNSINAEDAHWIYTAPSAGTLTLTTGAALMGPVEFSYSINGDDPIALSQSSTYPIEMYTGDIIRIDVIAEGYSSLTAAWSGESGEGGETDDALVLGDNAIALAEGQIDGATYTYTAAEAGTLTIEATYLEYYDAATDSWNISGEDFDLAVAFARNYTLTANGSGTASNVLTVDVAAGDVVSIYFGYNNLNVPETSATLKLSMGEGSGEEGGETGSGTGSDPYIINTLPYESTYVGGTDVYYEYTAAEAVTLLITVPSDVVCSGVGTDFVDNEDGTKTYTYAAAAGEIVSINPWNGSADGIFKVEADGSQGGDEPDVPTEPDGSMNNPYILDELYGTVDVQVAEDYGSVYYQYTATEDGIVAASNDDVNTYFVINDNWVYGSTEYAAGDVILIEFGAWTAGSYSVELYDPTVAKIGDVSFTSLNDALENAAYGATVTLCADVDACGYVVIPVGVSIDLGDYDLTADYVYGSKESSVVANVNSGRLIVPQGNLILGQSGINAEGREVLPVWDPANENYVFSQFIANTSSDVRGLFIDEAETTLYFQWKHQATGAINQGLIKDNGSSDNGISMIIRLEWGSADGQGIAYQNYVYKDAFVQQVTGNNDYKATLTGIDTLGIDMDTLVVYALIETESGAVIYGEQWTAEDAKLYISEAE